MFKGTDRSVRFRGQNAVPGAKFGEPGRDDLLRSRPDEIIDNHLSARHISD
jgi:hypothetical protein